MVAVYRWGTRELVLVCALADAHQLVPGVWYGRYVVVPLSGPDAALWRLMGYGHPTAAG